MIPCTWLQKSDRNQDITKYHISLSQQCYVIFSKEIWWLWLHLWWLGLALCKNGSFYLGRYICIVVGIVVNSFHWAEEIFWKNCLGTNLWWRYLFMFWLKRPVNSWSFFAYFVLAQPQILYNVLSLFFDNLFIFWRWIFEYIHHFWW